MPRFGLAPAILLCVIGIGSAAIVCGDEAHKSAALDVDALDSAAVRWSPEGTGGTPDFVKHVVPLFSKAGCSARECHGAFQGQNGFRLSLFGYDPRLDHDELTADEEGGPRVDMKDVDSSLALLKPLQKVDHEGGRRFEEGSWQHHVLRAWIAAGALYDAETAPYLMRLAVVPAELHIEVADSVRLRAVAWFSDGTCEEVTPLAAFTTNDESVAEVTAGGDVTASGLGDTAVVVSYGGGVVTCPIIVPRADSGPFPAFPVNNPIDDLVAKKLGRLGVYPSGLSRDDEFLRRDHVDLIGTLPTAVEVREFLADKRSDKRERLIERLLQRPEYALHWATILSDWTGNNQSNINNFLKVSGLWHDWLRDKLARNLPYDELVGGIITATSREGRPLEEYLKENDLVSANIADRDGFDDGTYARRETLDLFWLKRMPDRDKGLAIRAANSFLGVQIQCAECHKHPFDRWTQDDFEGFVSYFRVVRIDDLDGTERSGGRYDYDKVALYPGLDRRYSRNVEEHPPKILAGPVVAYEEGGADPRRALWEWMRSADNPYFAKNIVNRLWQHYFGVGIVDPVDDFNAANPPSNPALLEWLASDFVEHGFDLKHLHGRILSSRTYQLSHLPLDSNRSDRRNFSHALVKRMPAEVALDAVVQVTGTRLRFNGYAAPPGTRAIGLSASVRYGDGEYFMDIFGRPARVQTCACERSNEASLAQALFLINDGELHERITDQSGRVARLVEEIDDDGLLVEELFLTCLSRFPNDAEIGSLRAFLEQAESRTASAEDLLWSLINVREFLIVR